MSEVLTWDENPEDEDWKSVRSSSSTHNHARKFCLWCALQTIGFPIEHLAWEKLPVLSSVTRLLGL